LSRTGASVDGRAVAVPQYQHDVSLDYGRIEVALQYALTERWDVSARVPWEQKRQSAGMTFIDATTVDDRAAMQRNIDLHHRSVTLRGLSDLMLLGRRRWSDLWREGDVVTLSGGTTFPTGRTVENPYALGNQGIQHLHIQFGTGTFDALIEASYAAAVAGRLSSGAYLASRLSFYENSRTFRAPPEATFGAYVAQQTSDRLRLRFETAAYGQGYGYWDGLRDENTGLFALSTTAGVTFRWNELSVNAEVRYPIAQRTFDEGDAFEQGPSVVVTIGGTVP
jgi:hypothetical protein